MTIWQHVSFEGTAAIDGWIQKRGAKATVCRLDLGEKPVCDDVLLILGGPMSATGGDAFLDAEKKALEAHLKAGGKVYGICLGAQLIASVLGATISPCAHREAGWRNVRFLDDTLLRGFGSEAVVFHWHSETFSLPHGAKRLAQNDACENQMFSYANGNVLASQFHFEATPTSVEALLTHDGAFLQNESPFVQSPQTIHAAQANFHTANGLLYSLLDRWAYA